MQNFCVNLTETEFGKDSIIIDIGEKDENLYIVKEGKVEGFSESFGKGYWEEGSFFEQEATLNCALQMQFKAESERVSCLTIPKSALKNLLGN